MSIINYGGPGRTTADGTVSLIINTLGEPFGKNERIDCKALSNGYPERSWPKSEPL